MKQQRSLRRLPVPFHERYDVPSTSIMRARRLALCLLVMACRIDLTDGFVRGTRLRSLSVPPSLAGFTGRSVDAERFRRCRSRCEKNLVWTRSSSSSFRQGISRSSPLHMSIDPQSSVDAFVASSPFPLSEVMTLLTSPTVDDPNAEAALFNDLSHVTLDLITLLNPATAILRLLIVIGRLFGMASDFIPDHFMKPDELFFQGIMLVISIFLLTRSVWPIIRSLFLPTTELDQMVFDQLFQPAGVSWLQYKSMAASCIDWITVEPGTVLVNESESWDIASNSQKHAFFHETPDHEGEEDVDYLYWQYQGEVVLSFRGFLIKHIQRSTGKNIDDPDAMGFLADMRFLYNLDKKNKEKTKNKKKKDGKKKDVKAAMDKYPMATITVGSKGATLMRMNCARLFELMDHDEQLASSIRNLLLKSLQRKVGYLLISKTESLTMPEIQPSLLDEPHGATTHDKQIVLSTDLPIAPEGQILLANQPFVSSTPEKQIHEEKVKNGVQLGVSPDDYS